jgi:hypothetical protein
VPASLGVELSHRWCPTAGLHLGDVEHLLGMLG